MSQCFPGSDLVLLAAAISIILSDGLSADETSILSGLFTSIGDNLAIVATKKQFSENNNSSSPNTK
jgi:urea transporter